MLLGAGAVPGRANEAPIQAFSELDNLDIMICAIDGSKEKDEALLFVEYKSDSPFAVVTSAHILWARSEFLSASN